MATSRLKEMKAIHLNLRFRGRTNFTLGEQKGGGKKFLWVELICYDGFDGGRVARKAPST